MRAGSLRSKAVLAAVAVVGVVPLVAGTGVASANPALCGMVVSQSTTLTSDVGPCDGTAIEVTANNVVLNLNGRRVFGNSAERGEGPGILVAGRTGVTVRNGTVQHFDAGVAIEGGSANIVQGITAKDNIGVGDYGDGIVVFFSHRNRILNNVADHNGPYGGIDVVGNADDNVIEGNRVINNNVPSGDPHPGVPATQQDDGIRIEALGGNATPDRNVVRGNTILNSGLDGIAVFPGAKDNQLLGNTVHNNGFLGNARRGDGIHIFGFALRTIVQGNNVQSNAGHGIRIDATPSPDPTVQPRNRIIGNTVINNGLAPLPEDFGFDLSDQNRFCDQDLWQGNVHNTEDVIASGVDCYN